MKPKTCEQCGKEIVITYKVTEAYWERRKYCSYACRGAAFIGRPCPTKGAVLVSLEERFWSKVDKQGSDECWPWIGALHKQGYGKLAGTRGEKWRKAHRLSYELNIGAIPKGMLVLHGCDNPCCVNPAHLFLGTQRDNIRDYANKGGFDFRSGEGHAKLTLADVAEVRRLREEECLSQQKIADKFGVTQSAISALLLGKTWKHVNQ